MRTLSTYIEYLLMTRHYCYVPGRGAYMMSEEAASQGLLPSICADSRQLHHISAPSRQVYFSQLHHHDDGILAGLLMEAEGMTYDEANRYIERQAQLLPEDFSQVASLHTDVDNFGFGALEVETWSSIEQRLHPQPAVSGQTAASAQAPKLEIHRDRVSIPTRWIKRAAISLLIAIFFFTDFIGLNTTSQQKASVLSVSIMERPVLSSGSLFEDESLAASTDTSAASIGAASASIEPATEASTEQDLASADEPQLIADDAYYIIVASTNSEQYAMSVCRRYLSQDYHTAGILSSGGLHRVYINVFDDRAEASTYLRQIRQVNDRLSKSWLFPVKGGSLSFIIKNINNDNQLSMELSHPQQRTERDQG